MIRYCLGLGAFSVNKPVGYDFLVINLHVIYFLHLRSTLCTHTCHIFCILLLCSTAQKMRSRLMKTSSRRAKPRSTSCGKMGSIPLFSPSWTCSKFL
jgi:hypothetical protein